MQSSSNFSPIYRVLTPEQWRARADAHRVRAARFANPFVQRQSCGLKHPVDDFLFTYYTLRPAQLKRWHPGAGVIVLGAAEFAERRFYRLATESELQAAGLSNDVVASCLRSGSAAVVDSEAFLTKRSEAVTYVRQILTNTAQKPGFFGCFGMHEWAMAYRSEQNNIRHDYLSLRLGATGTDQVVESHRIRCSHFDAFRFFQPQAVALNEIQPSRERQRFLEQPACLHANMDVYKWAYKLLPLVDSDLLMDTFELAQEIRELDMRAAPYDLSDWGYEPIAVETAVGKAEYVRLQREFATRSVALRKRLLAAVDSLTMA